MDLWSVFSLHLIFMGFFLTGIFSYAAASWLCGIKSPTSPLYVGSSGKLAYAFSLFIVMCISVFRVLESFNLLIDL